MRPSEPWVPRSQKTARIIPRSDQRRVSPRFRIRVANNLQAHTLKGMGPNPIPATNFRCTATT